MEREEDIPALIYEARPVVRPWCSRPHCSAMAKQAKHASAAVSRQASGTLWQAAVAQAQAATAFCR